MPAVIAMLPLCAPEVPGLKATWMAALCPAARDNGKAGELTLKPLPVIVGCTIETLFDVPLVIVSLRLAVWPTVTVPKFKLACDRVTEPLGGGVVFDELPCTAWQPSNPASPKVTNRIPAQRLAMAFTC